MRFNSVYGSEGNKPLVPVQQDAMASVSLSSILSPQSQQSLYKSDQPPNPFQNYTECLNSNQHTTACVDSHDTHARRKILSHVPRHKPTSQCTPSPSTHSAHFRFRPVPSHKTKVQESLQSKNPHEKIGTNVRYVYYRPTPSPSSDKCVPSETQSIVTPSNYTLEKNLSPLPFSYNSKNNVDETDLLPTAFNSYRENSSLNFLPVNGSPNVLLEEGEVWSVKDLNLKDDIHDDQISLVSDDENDLDSLESPRQQSSENNICQKPSVAPNALDQPAFDSDRYSFWINKVQVRTVSPSYSDFSSCNLNVNIIVFKLSNLCLSFNSPLLEEFIIWFLPQYYRYLNTSIEQKDYFAEIFLIQSQLNPRSLDLLLMSFRRFNFSPTALHMGSNPDLGSEGMLVLSKFISDSKEPLRWLALPKCQASFSSFKTILTAVLSRLDIYPRIHNRESVPLWLELPTIFNDSSGSQKNGSSSFLLNTKVFKYLDSIRPGLYCPILNRTICRINCCGTPGAIFHIPKLSNPMSHSSAKAFVDNTSKTLTLPTLPSSVQDIAEMSEIDSEDEKDNSLPLSQDLSINGDENTYQAQALEQTEVTSLDNTLALAYQSLLQECFFSISMVAAEYQILPFNFLQDMASIYIEAEYLSSIPNSFVISSQSKETARSKRPRDTSQEETEEENMFNTFETHKNKTSFVSSSNSSNVAELSSCNNIEKAGFCHDIGQISDTNITRKGSVQNYQDDRLLNKQDQGSTSEEGEIPDVNVFSVAFLNHGKQLHSR
ncbi:uncharacterized protein LOC128883828 isoform X2 [Hylaeus volcanicus]|uniref:uncharacterized protein LOC128883828 isoform X2 n=1 Tax=Hylaeus volcanicus TaxID=313075 RepID=UPI0023B7CE13|nr:uncharacterized protein LOC128883828 isoform X2 [Hylaeus volcanicus]